MLRGQGRNRTVDTTLRPGRLHLQGPDHADDLGGKALPLHHVGLLSVDRDTGFLHDSRPLHHLGSGERRELLCRVGRAFDSHIRQTLRGVRT